MNRESDAGAAEVGQLLELTVGAVAHGGHCVARHAGRVVFVRHALPGERVVATVTEVRRSYLRADAVEVLDASPDRVVAPCPYAGPGRCGGCDFQHVAPAAQRRLKADVVREQLVRLGGLDPADVAGFTVAELPGGSLGWRTRVRYATDPDGRAGLRRHRSHDVLPVDRCLIAAPGIQAAMVPGPDGAESVRVVDRLWPGVSAVEVVRGASGTTVVTHGRGGVTVVDGPERVTERAAGRRWELAPEAFWQVHRGAADTFVECVLQILRPGAGERAWDLYGGAGLFAAALAERVGPGGRVVLVESDPAPDPRGNLADLPQVHVARGRVEQV
ncbi:MAG: class I SAM-dependent RNA methyltransferase, partial [Micromonosporaceae bacterium]